MDTKQKVGPQDEGINIGMPKKDRDSVAEILSTLLADQHTMYIKLRNYHWNVEGMHFQALHDMFQEQYEQLEKFIDDTAERIRALGHYSPGSMEEFRKMARLQETSNLGGDAKKMLENLLADHEMIIQTLRVDVDETADKFHDMGNSDFLTALMEEHEKMAWMLRSHLR